MFSTFICFYMKTGFTWIITSQNKYRLDFDFSSKMLPDWFDSSSPLFHFYLWNVWMVILYLTGVCPHTSASQETGTVDLTNIMSTVTSDIFNIINNVISSESGLQKLFKMISVSIPEFN